MAMLAAVDFILHLLIITSCLLLMLWSWGSCVMLAIVNHLGAVFDSVWRFWTTSSSLCWCIDLPEDLLSPPLDITAHNKQANYHIIIVKLFLKVYLKHRSDSLKIIKPLISWSVYISLFKAFWHNSDAALNQQTGHIVWEIALSQHRQDNLKSVAPFFN